MRIIFEVLDPDLGCSVFDTPNMRIIFEVLDPYLGCLVMEPPNERILFEVLDPDLGCLVFEPPNMQIVFEVLDPDLGCLGGLGGRSDSGPHVPRKCAKILQFYTVWEPPGVQKRICRIQRIHRIHRMKAKWYTTGTSDPRFSAPEVRMTVVMQTNSLKL